jgi:UDP-N-acetylmuramoylalanine--D-glutamate ligase
VGAFDGVRALVIGAGTSGAAAARTLADEGAIVLVSEAGDEVVHAFPEGVRVETGGHRREHLDGAEVVITSPGVPESAEVLAWAGERGLEIWSELELGARLCSVPYVAITGTNGKTTTTSIVAAVLRADGRDAVACGNIGHPFSLAAREGHEVLAVEASSFQLRFAPSFHPRVSALLNLAEDHLDWHGSREAYGRAKAAIFRLQTGPHDVHVGNADDPTAAALSASARCRLVWFRRDAPGPGEVGAVGNVLVSALEGRSGTIGEPTSPTGGFRADAAAATAVSLSFGASLESARNAIAAERPLPHRGTVVATIDGVAYVDDSKATNPHAVLAALEGMSDVVLIAGGRAKGVDLSPLRSRADRLVGVVAIGEAADEVVDVFAGAVAHVVRADTLAKAVREAAALVPAGGTVLLAPACASQDMFTDYRERGERFAAAVEALEQERSVGDPR